MSINNMKKLLFVILFLSSCNPALLTSTPIPTANPTKTPTVSRTALPTISPADYFQKILALDLQCPHICWAGINPGITSADDARTLLGTTETEKYETFQSSIPVTLRFEKGLVKSIYFDYFEIFHPLNDFIGALGQPDEIRIGLWSDYCDSFSYLLYYDTRKTVIEVTNGGLNGPNANQYISGMALNVEIDSTFFQNRLYYKHLSTRQPWLGYGHLQDYLPTQGKLDNPCLESTH